MSADQDAVLVKKALTYANGYRELEMFDHAIEEIEALPEHLRYCETAVQMRAAVYMQAKAWSKALPFVERLASDRPGDAGNFVNFAYVMRRARSLEEAKPILQKAAQTFPESAIIHYNLGCYACHSNELDVAKEHLSRAFELDAEFKKTALEDEDLSPLTVWIQEVVK
ncbi:MAG: hypothetical protein F6K21_14770 [Symploca sp. SIO2D2]|nr:hypothetical protein [Symploca sp. SIO2D2]